MGCDGMCCLVVYSAVLCYTLHNVEAKKHNLERQIQYSAIQHNEMLNMKDEV